MYSVFVSGSWSKYPAVLYSGEMWYLDSFVFTGLYAYSVKINT